MTRPPAVDRTLRLADPVRDAAGVAAIYAPHVSDGVASFEVVAPGADEMAHRIAERLCWSPWLVALDAEGETERLAGYAYAGRHAERAGYRWDVDISVYVAADRQGQGVGRRLYDALVPIIQLQRFLNVYAGIALPNPGSVRLHEAIGMHRLATYPRVGWKHGRWLDVAWFHMPLAAELPSPPPEPTALPDLLADPAGRAAVDALLGA